MFLRPGRVGGLGQQAPSDTVTPESAFLGFRQFYVEGANTDDAAMLNLAPATKTIVAATRGKYANSTRAATSSNSSIAGARVLLGPASLTELRLELNNWWLVASATGETVNTGTLSVEAMLVEEATGKRVRFKFSGSNVGTVPVTAGAARLVSDAVLPSQFGLTLFPAYSRWRIILRRTAATSGDQIPWGGQYGELSRVGEYDYWYPDSVSSAAAVASAYLDNPETLVQHIRDNSNFIVGLAHAVGRPNTSSSTLSTIGGMVLLGRANAPTKSIVIIGDSITDGSGDSVAPVPTDAGAGWFCRAILTADGLPIGAGMRVSISGDRAQYAASVNTLRRNAFAQATHVVIALGNNDVFGSRTLTQIRDDLRTLATLAKAQGAVHVTMALVTPRTTSTDSWATTENQTVVSNFGVGALRDQVNAQIVADVASRDDMDDYIDFSPAIEESGTNKWLANMTADGIHPTPAGHAAMANIARAKFAALTPALV